MSARQTMLPLPLLLAAAATLSSRALAHPAPAPSPQDPDSGSGYGDTSPNGLDVQGGASGTSNSFSLSTGGIVAICVVVALVVIGGAASTVLFYMAKKRQWQVRKSISRASRRVTARITGRQLPTRAEEERRARRHGAVRLAEGQSRAARELEKKRRTQAAAGEVKMTEIREKVTERAGGAGVVGPAPPRKEGGGKKVGVVLPPPS